MEKVTEGYGKGFPNLAYNSPDFEMLRHLQQNVYSFSAAKNYQQLKDMTMALTDGDRLRSESEYIDAVRAMNLKYNRDWLLTERNTAIAGGQMASRWLDFEQNADIMPMLRYVTVGDGKVRQSHRALDGVTKAIDDPFWATYYPPNGWGCRCTVIQVPDEGERPTQGETAPPDVPPMFQTNLAKTGLIFPKGHPYFNGVPKPELRPAMSYLPPENSYFVTRGYRKQTINVHLLHNEPEVAGNLTIANDLLRLGYKKIKLLPDLHEKEAALKVRFYPKDYKPISLKKNPDAWLQSKDGRNMVCDFKLMHGERSFTERVAEAAKQAEYAVIKLDFEPKKLGVGSIRQRIAGQMEKNERLRGVIVLDKDGKLLYEYFRP